MKKWLQSAGQDVLLSWLQDLDTPISLSIAIQLRYGCYSDLSLRWLDPRNYLDSGLDAFRFRRDLMAVDLLRKADLPGGRKERTSRALKAWEDAETMCFKTNELIASIWRTESFDFRTSGLGKFLAQIRQRISRWLGPLPDLLEGGFGPGTCVECRGQALPPTVMDKLYVAPATTNGCAMLFEWHYSRTLWGQERWKNRLGAPVEVRGNELTFVPKDAKTDRPISIEPLGNLWLQLGIGRCLKRRLQAIGLPAYRPVERELFPGHTWKERDAQWVHREVLRRPHAFCTVDLTSASDTLAYELVRAVLPPDWFLLLESCRSPMTKLPKTDSAPEGVWRHLEKFSSMGNGFTFELESMIFCASLAVAFGLTPGEDLFVFGDDLIFPREHYDEAAAMLRLLGFQPNLKKSFKDPPFYESCGANWFLGVDVTPVRLKGPLDSPSKVIAFHNALRATGYASRRTLNKLRLMVPKQYRVTGPRRLGDQVFHGTSFVPTKRRGWCPQTLWLRVVNPAPVDIPLDRWSEELTMVGLLLCGSATARRGPAPDTLGWASVS